MLNWYLTNTCWFLHDYFLFNWSFTNAKLILIDSLNQINVYQYLTVTYQYLACADVAWIGNGIEMKLKNNLWA